MREILQHQVMQDKIQLLEVQFKPQQQAELQDKDKDHQVQQFLKVGAVDQHQVLL